MPRRIDTPIAVASSTGEAMVNQASLTGESMPVRKADQASVYAGTVVEEGEITVEVKAVGGSGRYDKIVTMIEDSQKLKSGLEGKAEHLADKLVPYTLAGTGLVYLATRNATKAIAVLMVDFSCALKLAMPISVLSAIREASQHNGITFPMCTTMLSPCLICEYGTRTSPSSVFSHTFSTFSDIILARSPTDFLCVLSSSSSPIPRRNMTELAVS